jgi:hypothetical protein
MPNPKRAIRVRRLCSEDLDRWRTLRGGYLCFYRADVPDM